MSDVMVSGLRFASIGSEALATVMYYAKRHHGVLPKVLLCAAPTYRALSRYLGGDGVECVTIYDVPVIVVGKIAPRGFQARGRDYWDNFR